MNEGWILLGVMGAIFVCFAIYVIVNWKKPSIPIGHLVTATYMEFTARVVFHKGTRMDPIKEKEFANSCAKAAYAVHMVKFKTDDILYPDEYHKFFVWVQTDTEYYKRISQKSAAYIRNANFSFGSKEYPLIIIRNEFVADVIKTGNPIIHELIHAILGVLKNPSKIDHDDKLIWRVSGGENSLESTSIHFYQDELL